MKTVTPKPGMVVCESCKLTKGVHVLPEGLVVANPEVMVDGAGATLVGVDRSGCGVTVDGVGGVTLRNLRVRGYHHGIVVRDARGVAIEGCDISETAEVPANTVFLDIWKPANEAYGAAILLIGVQDGVLQANTLLHQQNGVVSYHCRGLRVVGNNASYNSGFGFHLYDTCDSTFEDNCADYCCRFEPREGGLHYGHMGADAAGFVAVSGSSRNVFRRNAARLGGDGFFLAGLGPDGVPNGCDDNLFEENDGSLSPNIAFEATFCRGNVFRRNYADRSNFGFWLGYSAETLIEDSRMVMNRQAGVAVENGRACRVIGSTFHANGHGVLLWSRHVDQFAEAFPDRLTSSDWQIEGNVMTRNGKAIRIAANQDHGIRHGPETDNLREELRPYDHRIVGNDIQDNRIGIELYRTRETLVERNILNRNVEANLRQDDALGTIARNNLGAAGAYL